MKNQLLTSSRQTHVGEQANTWRRPVKQRVWVMPLPGLVGMNKGESKEVEATEEDYEVEPLGKTVIYSLEVHEVREKKAPG